MNMVTGREHSDRLSARTGRGHQAPANPDTRVEDQMTKNTKGMRGARVGRLTAIAGSVVALTLVASACSTSSKGGGGGGSKGGLSGTINVTSIQDLTGAVGSVGIATENGMKLAEDEVNNNGMLGSAKLNITFKDTQTTQAQSVSLATQTVSGNVTAIFGPVSSQEAVAVAPIIQSAKVPTIYTQAGSQGVITAGDYNFRVTAPQQYYQPKMAAYLKAQGVKTVDFIYDSTVPTTKDLTEKTMPPLMDQNGITIKGKYGFQNGTTDYSAYVSKVIADKPDAVGAEGTNPEASPVISSLRNAGYKGLIFGGTSFGAASLKAAGQLAKGVVWTTDFDPKSTFPQTAKFVQNYTAKYGTAPVNYAAEGYDAVYLLAMGLKNANSTDHAKLQAGLVQACKAGYAGALGQLTFDGNDLREDGYLQTFDGTAVSSVQS
jgi:branched-chain amino acid transport system substrate-binding protein